jgi:hypothetical protein
MSSILGEWREGKVRPVPGNAPHDRPVSRGIISPRSICDDPFLATRFPQQLQILPGPSVGVFKAWRNLSGPMWVSKKEPNPGTGPGHLPLAGPSPGKERAGRIALSLSHRPQMSSGRLFLDRVARQQWDTRRGRLDKEERNRGAIETLRW